jgi:hypothetical protein
MMSQLDLAALQVSLLGEGKLRLKGNCHCHSTYSDGTKTPADTVDLYRNAGYDFLYLTEHCDKLTYDKFPDFNELDCEEIRVMPGVEYRNTTSRNDKSEMAMILGLNTLKLSHWKPGLDQQSTINAINDDGGMAILSCTYWDGRTANDMINLRGVAGIEIYNATCEGACSKGIAVMHWDELLESGMRLWGIALDDAHLTDWWPDFALGWIVVLADSKSPDAIKNAIRNGNFYSSCGPTIEHWTRQGTTVTFQCSPAKTISWNSIGPYGGVFRGKDGETLTQATLDLSELQEGLPFVRFSCCDEQGRWAWTNPIWL